MAARVVKGKPNEGADYRAADYLREQVWTLVEQYEARVSFDIPRISCVTRCVFLTPPAKIARDVQAICPTRERFKDRNHT